MLAKYYAIVGGGMIDSAFRHTLGSQLAKKGEGLYKLATLLGNSLEISRRHYVSLCTEALTAPVEFNTLPPGDMLLRA